MKEPEFLSMLKRRKPGVIRTVAALLAGDLFRRPVWKPGKVLEYDLRDFGPNRHLSDEAKKAGVTIPNDGRNRPRRRLF
jgi:hypothetical protein